MSTHSVSLPYPARSGSTMGTCSCGTWEILYAWGGHDWAQDEASSHVRDAARAESIVTAQMNGDRLVIPGRSL